MALSSPKRVENTVGIGEILSPFPTVLSKDSCTVFSKDLYCRQVKTLFGKRLNCRLQNDFNLNKIENFVIS